MGRQQPQPDDNPRRRAKQKSPYRGQHGQHCGRSRVHAVRGESVGADGCQHAPRAVVQRHQQARHDGQRRPKAGAALTIIGPIPQPQGAQNSSHRMRVVVMVGSPAHPRGPTPAPWWPTASQRPPRPPPSGPGPAASTSSRCSPRARCRPPGSWGPPPPGAHRRCACSTASAGRGPVPADREASPERQRAGPLRQTPVMVIHPPAMHTGLIGMGVPFALFIAWWQRLPSESWTPLVRRRLLFDRHHPGRIAACIELGWAGYWEWDPATNASRRPRGSCTHSKRRRSAAGCARGRRDLGPPRFCCRRWSPASRGAEASDFGALVCRRTRGSVVFGLLWASLAGSALVLAKYGGLLKRRC